MLTLFTPEKGKISAVARRCKSAKSPLLTATELFCSGEYTLYHAHDRYTVVSCQVVDSFYPIREDYERLTHGMYLLDLCRACVQPEQENERLFLLLLKSLAHLAYGQASPQNITAVFLMGFSSLLGFRPRVARCVKCGKRVEAGIKCSFAPEQGGILCEEHSEERPLLTEQELLYLQMVMKKGLLTLDEPINCSDNLFEHLCEMAEERAESPIRSAAGIRKGKKNG